MTRLSPAVCVETAVPSGVVVMLHAPSALHTRVWHSVSGPPGQSLATLHPTQTPAALQTAPLLSLQNVPCICGVCVGLAPLHESIVQATASSHTTRGPATQCEAWQASTPLQNEPSSQSA